MSEIIVLRDGRGWCGASWLTAALLAQTSEALPPQWGRLAEWLRARARQPNGLIGFDCRSFRGDTQRALLSALALASERVAKDGSASERLIRLREMLRRADREEPPDAMNDLSDTVPFGGHYFDLG